RCAAEPEQYPPEAEWKQLECLPLLSFSLPFSSFFYLKTAERILKILSARFGSQFAADFSDTHLIYQLSHTPIIIQLSYFFICFDYFVSFCVYP
ncbi:MAG: hypothetical protein KH812_20375, partial [Proteus hauseri]|nr:hypothetical protein [Proteus hauseri]